MNNNDYDKSKYIPTDLVIKKALEKGVYLGNGDPKNRIRYLIKLGLIPNQKRKKINGKMVSLLPADTVDRLVAIQNIQKKFGLSVSEVRQFMSSGGALKDTENAFELDSNDRIPHQKTNFDVDISKYLSDSFEPTKQKESKKAYTDGPDDNRLDNEHVDNEKYAQEFLNEASNSRNTNLFKYVFLLFLFSLISLPLTAKASDNKYLFDDIFDGLTHGVAVLFSESSNAQYKPFVAGVDVMQVKESANVLGISDTTNKGSFMRINMPLGVNGLTVSGKSFFKDDVTVDNKNLDLKNGKLYASNVVYSVGVGDGLEAEGTQNVKIKNKGVLSIGGISGDVSLGSGLGFDSFGNLTNLGVTDIDGSGGSIKLGKGLAFESGTLVNTGVTEFGGTSGSLDVGDGLDIKDGKIVNKGVISLGGNKGKIDVGTGLDIIDGTLVNTSNADKVFSNIKSGSSQFSANSTSDTLTFKEGSGITIGLSDTDKSITISSTSSYDEKDIEDFIFDDDNTGTLSSGTLDLSNLGYVNQLPNSAGGTGIDTSAATDGQILIGNGSGFDLNTITQGIGVTITNTPGNISISANLGNSIDSSEILDGEVSVNDLNNLAPPTDGQMLTYDATSGQFRWVDSNSSIPGDITAIGDVDSGNAFTKDDYGNSIWFEGPTFDNNDIQLTANDPTGNVTVYLPTKDGTLAVLSDIKDLNLNAGSYTYVSLDKTSPTENVIVLNGVDLTNDVINILPTTNGGTGINASGASNGTLLIGNGSGFDLSTLTAGSGVNITNGDGSITVSSVLGSSVESSEITDGEILTLDLNSTNSPVNSGDVLTYGGANNFTWVDKDNFDAGSLNGLTSDDFLRSNADDNFTNNATLTFDLGTTLTLASGNVFNINGNWFIGGTQVNSTASEINALSGAGVDNAEYSVLDAGIDLGTETNGNYIQSIIPGNGLTGVNTSGEGVDATINVGAGDGINVLADSITLSLASQKNVTQTQSASGLEVDADGLSLLTGCSQGQVLMYDSTGGVWKCATASDIGAISGSGAAGYVTFWDSANSITGESNLFWDSTNNRLGINESTPLYALDINGDAYLRDGVYVDVNSSDNYISSAAAGLGSAQLYIGNEYILREKDVGGVAGSRNIIQPYDANTTILGSSIDGTEIDDGSIASIDITDGTIVNVDIADDTIKEPKLSVTNTPTDGYVLAYDSATNGFTWVDGSSFSSGYWQYNSGVISPNNATDKVAIGGTGSTAPIYITDTGIITFSSDTNLYRSSANSLKTDDTFRVGGTGDIYIENGDLSISSIFLSQEGSSNAYSGATLVGVYPGTIPNVTSNVLQTALEELGTAISNGGGGTVTQVGDSTGATPFAADDTGYGNSLWFEGATTNDNYEIRLTAADPTDGDKTITLPSATGTVTLGTGSTTGTLTYWSGTNTTASASSLYWDSGNSRLGIGASSPLYALDVSGDTYLRNGVYVGANNTDNYVSTASTGTGSAQLYVGNEYILREKDVGGVAGSRNVVQPYDANTTILGSSIDGTEIDDGSIASIDITDGTIANIDIADDTIKEPKLNVTNAPTDGYILSYDSATGGFTWVANDGGSGASLFTDSGAITYLTSTTDDLALGGTTSDAAFYMDVSASALNLNPYGTAAGNTGEIRFQELEANGDNYTGFKAPDSLTSNVIYRLPTSDATTANQVLASDASGNLSWIDVSSGSGGIGGSGTTNYVARWTNSSSLGIGKIYDDGTNVSVGGTSPSALFNVGSSNEFQVDSTGNVSTSGAISTTGNLSADGTVTFASLNSGGVVKSNTSGVLGIGSVDLTSEVTGTLPVANGGTGLTGYLKGDLIIASADNALGVLNITTNNGDVLSVNSTTGLPEWVGTGTWDKDSSDDLTTATNFGGDVSGLYNNLQLGTGVVGATELASTSVTAGSYGSATMVPVFTVDEDGRLTAVSTQAIPDASNTNEIQNLWETINADTGTTTADTSTDTLTIQGSGIASTSITGDTLTITATEQQNLFQTIAVSGQNDVIADNTTDTLTLAAGNNITITTDDTTDTITIAASTSGGYWQYDSGNGIVYPNNATDDVAIGGSTVDSPFYMDVSASALNLNPYGTAAGNTGEIRFQELEANGDNYTGFKAPDSLTSNVIYRLPTSDATTANQVLASDAAGNLSWIDVSSGSGGIGGAGTTNYVARWTNSSSLGIGKIYDDGTNVSVGGTSPSALFNVGSSNEFQVDSTGNVSTSGAISTTGNLSADGTVTFASLNSGGVVKSNTSGVLGIGQVDLTSEVTGTLPVANGGTGLTTVSAHSLVVGNGTNALTVLSNGTSGQLLKSGGAGADPSWVDAGSIVTAGNDITVTNNVSSATVALENDIDVNNITSSVGGLSLYGDIDSDSDGIGEVLGVYIGTNGYVNIGGGNSPQAELQVGNSANLNAALDGTDDAYIADDLEVDGEIYLNNEAVYTTMLGDRIYTNDNYVADSQTFTASIDALDTQVKSNADNISNLQNGQAGLWHLTGTVIHPGVLTNDVAIGGTDTTAPFFFDESAGRLTLNTNGSGAGLVLGSDTQIYRSAANELRTPDDFRIDGNLIVQGYLVRQCNSANISTAGWYRIASNGPVADGGTGGSRAYGKFTVWDTDGGEHSTTTFYAGVSYGNNPTLSVVERSKFSGGLIDKVRLVEGDTYEGAAVEVYVDGTNLPGTVYYCIEDNYQTTGWTPENWTSGSVPTGFTTTQLDLDTYDPVMATASNTNNNTYVLKRDGSALFAGNVGIEGSLYDISNTTLTINDDITISGGNVYIGDDGEIRDNGTNYLYTPDTFGIGGSLYLAGGLMYDNENILIDLDNNNDGSNYFAIRDGGNTEVFKVEETGDITATGDATVSGGDITGANGEYIDIGEEVNGDIRFHTDSDANDYIRFDLDTNSYPEIRGVLNGGDTLVEFPTGIYVTGNSLYSSVAARLRAGIYDDIDYLHLNSRENMYFNIDYDNNDSDSRAFIWAKNNSGISGTELMRLTESGGMALGTTALDSGVKLQVSGGDIKTDNQLISSIASGTAPLIVSSNTKVTNLNADLLDGFDSSAFQPAGSYDNYSSWTARDSDGTSYTVTSGDILTFDEGSGIDVNFTADDQLTITSTLGTAVEKGELANSGTLAFDWADSEVADNLTINSSGSVSTAALSGQVSLANGGTGANLSDPNADRIMFWDDSASSVTWLSLGSGLSISGTTLSADSSNAGPWTLSGSNLYPDSTSYNVALGKTSASEKLDVAGNITLSGNIKGDSTDSLRLQAGGTTSGSSGNSSIFFLNSAGTVKGRIDTTNASSTRNEFCNSTGSSTSNVDCDNEFFGPDVKYDDYMGQTFTPTESGAVTKIRMKFYKYGSTSKNFAVEIRSGVGGTVLATSNNVAVTSGMVTEDFTFSSPATVNSGSVYMLDLTCTTCNDTDYAEIRSESSNDPYSRGDSYTSYNGGASWTQVGGVDLWFEVYLGSPQDYGTLHIGKVDLVNADLAENYPSVQDLDKGEIVAIDTLNSKYIKRSTKAYQSNVIGVISSDPGLVLGSPDVDHSNQYPVALAGRVPIKVTNENGDIKVGDYITSSSMPGIGMKATQTGYVIGKALESYSFKDDEDVGEVLVFVQPGWYFEEYKDVVTTDRLEDDVFELSSRVDLLEQTLQSKLNEIDAQKSAKTSISTESINLANASKLVNKYIAKKDVTNGDIVVLSSRKVDSDDAKDLNVLTNNIIEKSNSDNDKFIGVVTNIEDEVVNIEVENSDLDNEQAQFDDADESTNENNSEDNFGGISTDQKDTLISYSQNDVCELVQKLGEKGARQKLIEEAVNELNESKATDGESKITAGVDGTSNTDTSDENDDYDGISVTDTTTGSSGQNSNVSTQVENDNNVLNSEDYDGIVVPSEANNGEASTDSVNDTVNLDGNTKDAQSSPSKTTYTEDDLSVEIIDEINSQIENCKNDGEFKAVTVIEQGVAKINVDESNGKIKSGDLLTLSKENRGYATKLDQEGWVIARSLEDSSEYVDQINVLILSPWYKQKQDQKLTLNDSDNKAVEVLNLLEGSKDIEISADSKLSVLGNAIFTGNTTFNDLTVNGILEAGLIDIDGLDGSITVNGEPLKLQSGPNAGNIDMFNGKIVFNSNGEILNVDGISVNKQYVVSVKDNNSDVNENSVGSGIIKSGSTYAIVKAALAKPESKIFVTARSLTGGQELIVTDINDGEFKVEIEKPIADDIKFDYWILGVYDATKGDDVSMNNEVGIN